MLPECLHAQGQSIGLFCSDFLSGLGNGYPAHKAHKMPGSKLPGICHSPPCSSLFFVSLTFLGAVR